MFTNTLRRIQGSVLLPTDEQFNLYRSVWNKSADSIPHIIVIPECEQDVSLAVQYAVEMNKSVCVRGGGHHFAGLAVQDDAVMLHMRRMNKIQVDTHTRTVRVGAGATIGELDTATQRHGFAVPTGTSSGTGVAGLTLGGGFGHLRRQYGLTCDQLLGARMVLANGNVVNVSDEEKSDIFWAIRGGGGNLGVVTEFEFQLNSVGPQVAVLDVYYDISDFPMIMSLLRDVPHTAPDTISFHLLISPLPPNPSYPLFLHGKWVIRILGMVNGDPELGMKTLDPFRHLAQSVFDKSGIQPYLELQSCLDANFPDGNFYDGTSVFLERITQDLIETVERLLKDPQPVSLQFWMLGGQINRFESTDTAFQVRNADWVVFVNAAGSDRNKLQKRSQWMREAVKRLGQHSIQKRMYANAVGNQELMQFSVAENIYGDNLKRLLALKQSLDCENIFRHNVNVHP